MRTCDITGGWISGPSETLLKKGIVIRKGVKIPSGWRKKRDGRSDSPGGATMPPTGWEWGWEEGEGAPSTSTRPARTCGGSGMEAAFRALQSKI